MMTGRFAPFSALLFDDPLGDPNGVLDLSAVIAPDNASTDELVRSGCAAGDRFNIVHLLGGEGASTAARWSLKGVIRQEKEPSIYACRSGWHSSSGEPYMSVGVFVWGSLPGKAPMDPFQVVPQIGSVELADLGPLLSTTGELVATATDADGAHHRLSRVRAPGVISTVCELLDSTAEVPISGLAFMREEIPGSPMPPLGMVFAGNLEFD